MKPGHYTDTEMGKIFRKYFAWSGEQPFDLPFWAIFLNYQPTAINQKQITMSLHFFTLIKVYTVTKKKKKTLLTKNNTLLNIIILSQSQKRFELNSTLHNRAKKKSEIFVISSIIIWTNFILTLPWILKQFYNN